MKEVIFNGNIFEYAKEHSQAGENMAVVVTTNGVLRTNGDAVMGAGIAKYAKVHLRNDDLAMLRNIAGLSGLNPWDKMDCVLGKMLKMNDNHAFYLGHWFDMMTNASYGIITMPTKHDWRDDSDIKLIEQSAREMMNLKTVNNLTSIYLPAPGCSCGKLSFADVQPVISSILDDSFTCVHPQF